VGANVVDDKAQNSLSSQSLGYVIDKWDLQ